jgi:hypothetical protein
VEKKPALVYRAVFPFCETGCDAPSKHFSRRCLGKPKPRVKDWPDDHPYTLQIAPAPALLAAECRALWHQAHRVHHPLTGLTPACERTAQELGFEEEDFEPQPGARWPDFLPRALLFGCAPFDPRALAAAVVDKLERNAPWPARLPLADPLVAHVADNKFIAKCIYKHPYVVQLPHGARASDYALTHADESTHARTRLRGDCVQREFDFKLETSDGATHQSPIHYIETWLQLKLDELELELLRSADLLLARKAVVSDVVCAAKNAHHKRKWIDESLPEKLARAELEHPMHAHELVFGTPLAAFEPRFEQSAPALHPRPELVRLLTAYLSDDPASRT